MKWRLPLRAWLLLVVYWPALFVSTHIPQRYLANVHIHTTDIFLHGLSFLLLTLLFWLTFNGGERPSFRRKALYHCLIILAGYAVMDELSQAIRFVNRTPDWKDWFADMTGIITALGMLYLFRRAFYWLILTWLAYFFLRHHALWTGNELVSGPWLQYRALFYTLSYLVLTLMLWRSLCRNRFHTDKRILITTLITLPTYLAVDEIISVATGGRTDSAVIVGGLTGIVTGILCALALSRHQSQVSEAYGSSKSS